MKNKVLFLVVMILVLLTFCVVVIRLSYENEVYNFDGIKVSEKLLDNYFAETDAPYFQKCDVDLNKCVNIVKLK